MSRYTLLRLTRDITNTEFDRRNRYGAAAIETFEAGTLMRLYPRTDAYSPETGV